MAERKAQLGERVQEALLPRAPTPECPLCLPPLGAQLGRLGIPQWSSGCVGLQTCASKRVPSGPAGSPPLLEGAPQKWSWRSSGALSLLPLHPGQAAERPNGVNAASPPQGGCSGTHPSVAAVGGLPESPTSCIRPHSHLPETLPPGGAKFGRQDNKRGGLCQSLHKLDLLLGDQLYLAEELFVGLSLAQLL